jgi:hypothetical protein
MVFLSGLHLPPYNNDRSIDGITRCILIGRRERDVVDPGTMSENKSLDITQYSSPTSTDCLVYTTLEGCVEDPDSPTIGSLESGL